LLGTACQAHQQGLPSHRHSPGRPAQVITGRFPSLLPDLLSIYRTQPDPGRHAQAPGRLFLVELSLQRTSKPDTLITPHNYWLLLGEDDTARTTTYRELSSEALAEPDIDHIRQSINTGLPAGNDRFRKKIEQVLSVRPGQGKRGRLKKTNALK
jgi:hypothetical protein